jgi:hypothetical protein
MPFCAAIFLSISFRISALERISRYPRGCWGSSIRRTPICRAHLIFEIASLPQHDTERWIGQSWLRRSLMEFLLFRFKARLEGELPGILKPTATQGEFMELAVIRKSASGLCERE